MEVALYQNPGAQRTKTLRMSVPVRGGKGCTICDPEAVSPLLGSILHECAALQHCSWLPGLTHAASSLAAALQLSWQFPFLKGIIISHKILFLPKWTKTSSCDLRECKLIWVARRPVFCFYSLQTSTFFYSGKDENSSAILLSPNSSAFPLKVKHTVSLLNMPLACSILINPHTEENLEVPILEPWNEWTGSWTLFLDVGEYFCLVLDLWK